MVACAAALCETLGIPADEMLKGRKRRAALCSRLLAMGATAGTFRKILATALAFAAGIEKGTTQAVAAAEDERAAEGRYRMARMVEAPYQNPQEFMYCGERTDKNCCIAKVHWLRWVRRGAIRPYKEEGEVEYLLMNAVIERTGLYFSRSRRAASGKANST